MTKPTDLFYTEKGVTDAGRPFAIVFEFSPHYRPGDDPIRILGRYEDDVGDLIHFFIDQHPDGGYARRQERPFARGEPIALTVDMHSPSPWLLIPPGILECMSPKGDPRLMPPETDSQRAFREYNEMRDNALREHRNRERRAALEDDFQRALRLLASEPEIELPAYLTMLRGMYVDGLVTARGMDWEGRRWMLDCIEQGDAYPPASPTFIEPGGPLPLPPILCRRIGD